MDDFDRNPVSDARHVTIGTRTYGMVRNLLLKEPSWFLEAGSGFGTLLWGALALLSDDYDLPTAGYVMPVVGMMFGPWRMIVVRGSPFSRALACGLGSIWWVCLLSGLLHKYGLISGESLVIMALVGDILSIGKFSIIALELLRAPAPEGA